jgi:putative ABC transport system permease protein
MFRNYLHTGWRYLAANRLFSAINVLGLAIGMMSCILILLFVRDELSHDRNLEHADSIVRLHTAYRGEGRAPFLTVRSAGRIMEALREYAPDLIDSGVRLLPIQATMIRDDKVFRENITFADGSFFDVLDLPLAEGNSATAFSKPMDLLVSEAMAHKYFGRRDVVGETLTVCCLEGKPIEVKISGVLEDLPRHSHLDIDFLVFLVPEMFAFAPNLLDTWTSVNTYTYFKLRPGVTAAQLQERYWYWLDHESVLVEMMEGGGKPTDSLQPTVMPVADIYLHARPEAGSMGDMRPLGDINLVRAFNIIAVVILLVASVNFMNLSTARGAKRAREVALRKVVGASRAQVASQFLGEAVVIALLSLLFALVAVEVLLPAFNQAVDRELELRLLGDLPLLLLMAGIAVVVGLLAGSYPAIHLSKFLPARVLKANQSVEESGAGRVRTLLVVFQYAISISLAVYTAVIFAQTMYARSLDPGYSVAGKLILEGIATADASRHRDSLVSELERIDGVRSVVLSSDVPTQDFENNSHYRLLDQEGGNLRGDGVLLNHYSTGYGFFEGYDMEFVAGRGFDSAFGSEAITAREEGDTSIGKSSVVINESAVRALGIDSPEAAIGRVLRANIARTAEYDLEIVGVIQDVYFRSIRFGIRPSIYLNFPNAFRSATVSFETNDVGRLLEEVEAVWRDIVPMEPFAHRFLEDMVSAQYDEELRQARLFGGFAILAIAIASLGLYGLASFTAERRTREIGIRKVMGARVRDIVSLLAWQFSVPVLLANAIAWPVAWYLTTGWLEAFHYRIGTGFVISAALAAGVISLLIAWLTVAGRAVSVARANPVQALRYE